jgi:lipopolysaccharide/colanic/teichoic acid biosynthesis glycosyltransferase
VAGVTSPAAPALGIKRVVDVVGALALLILAAPLLGVCVLWVRRRDPGPAFFRQARGGRGGTTFSIWKLRTMHVGSCDGAELLSDAAGHEHWEQSRRSSADPRVIPGVGAILRRSSLDELPQLWNVLRGDMSLVGPRPLELMILAALPPDVVRQRAAVRPGLTGLWQVSGRCDLDLRQLLDLDLTYVQTRSLWLDFRILCRTPAAVITGRGAY